jgi:hypothetical protein
MPNNVERHDDASPGVDQGCKPHAKREELSAYTDAHDRNDDGDASGSRNLLIPKWDEATKKCGSIAKALVFRERAISS